MPKSLWVVAVCAAVAVGLCRADDKKDEKKADVLVKIVHVETGKVLDVNNASADEGAHLIIWDDKGKEEGFDNQRFQWVGKGDERRLKAKNSGLVLDAEDDGHVVQKKADEKSKAQLWKVVEVKGKK